MKNWEEFFNHLNTTLKKANKEAEKSALIDPGEYALWEGVRKAYKLVFTFFKNKTFHYSMLSNPRHWKSFENIIDTYKTQFKNIRDSIDTSITSVEEQDRITIKSAYGAMVEIETKFKEVKEYCEKTKMSVLRKQETDYSAEEIQ